MSTPKTHAPTAHQQAAADREAICRISASFFGGPFSHDPPMPCYFRKCRRNRFCSGPMRPCEPLRERAWRLAQAGITSIAETTLPACVTAISGETFDLFEDLQRQMRKAVEEAPFSSPAKLARAMKQDLHLTPQRPVRR